LARFYLQKRAHYCSRWWTSPTRWLQSEPRKTAFAQTSGTLTAAPAPGIPGPTPGPAARAADPHPEMTLHPALVIIAASEPERKGVLLPATTARRKTNTADINGGSCLHPKQRPPLRYG
jgi:hypothetical protein